MWHLDEEENVSVNCFAKSKFINIQYGGRKGNEEAVIVNVKDWHNFK
jgi:hypothetical protein